jgi:hypothetical protein
MNIGSVSSAYGAYPTQSLQRTPEAAEVGKSGRENDGDPDDGSGSVSAAPSTPAPSVNMNGQKVGQIINVSA